MWVWHGLHPVHHANPVKESSLLSEKISHRFAHAAAAVIWLNNADSVLTEGRVALDRAESFLPVAEDGT